MACLPGCHRRDGGGTKRKASGAAAATAAPDVGPLAVVPASLASVNSQHYSEVQMWLEEILGNAILKDLEQAMPLDIANGGHMVTPFLSLVSLMLMVTL